MQGLRSSKTLFQNGLIVPATSKVLVPECRLVLIELVLCGFTLRDDERREGFRRDRRDRGIPGPNTGTWGTHIGERWATWERDGLFAAERGHGFYLGCAARGRPCCYDCEQAEEHRHQRI